MQSSVKRATAFAVVGTLSLSSPLIGALVAVPFALIAVLGRMITDGPLFNLFARPADRIDGQLRGLVAYALTATGLALLTALTQFPVVVFVSAVLLVSYGNLTERIVREYYDTRFHRAVGFTSGGTLAGFGGQAAVAGMLGSPFSASVAGFLALSGALVAALLRAVFSEYDDPLIMVFTAFTLWLFVELGVAVPLDTLVFAVLVAGAFGYASWALGTASVTGMFTGVIIALLAIVLGGFGWFVILITFFGLGGLASKYRYEEKRRDGVAEPNGGARGSRNVLGNASVALVAVIGFAASTQLPIEAMIFVFAFSGSLATAMSDTLSSEIGVLFGPPRLITSFQTVKPGTDGGMSIEGTIAGIVGAGIIAIITFGVLDVSLSGAFLIFVGGTAGMIVDSFLGATVEGRLIGNQTVNLLATLIGASVSVAGAIGVGIVTI